MRQLTRTAMVLCVALAVVGCESSKTTGPGGKELSLTKPSDQTIKRGATDEIKVSIGRTNFRDAVTVRFDDLPAGVTVQDKDRKIDAEQTSATFTLRADEMAEIVKDVLAKVTAMGPDGMKTSETFKITVKE